MDTREDIFDALGFQYGAMEQPAPAPPTTPSVIVDRVRARFAEMVYTTAHFEDIGFNWDEVEQLVGGVTVGGRTLEQEQQLLNEARAWHHLTELMQRDDFRLNEKTYCELHRLLARDPALTWGVFEDPSGVFGGPSRRTPRRYIVDERFEPGMHALDQIEDTFERAAAVLLFVSLNAFLINFNGRVARLLMQGTLMQNGYMPVVIPPHLRMEFDIRMMRFYDSLDATDVMRFLIAQCHASLETPNSRRKQSR